MKRKLPTAIITSLIIGLILIFTALGAYTLMQRNRPEQNAPAAQGGGGQGGQRQGGGGQRSATVVRVTPVVRDTIENSVVINGDILAVNQVSIFPTVAGRITRTYYQVGDRINQGAVVAMVDPSRPGQIYSDSPVISTIGGTLLQTPVHRGDTVSAQTAVVVVGDLSTLMVETFVPERFSNAAQRGLTAQVFLEALPGEVFSAVVEEVSPVLDPSSRTVRIRLRFTGGTDQRIKAGMFATVSLVTNTRRNVPVIPRGAVINTYGSWIVFAVNEQNIASRREVSLGLENELFVEVTGGLEIGDMIVSSGQNFLTDGDPVRIVE
ncbi:MAG: efflux RND transporter periplasmic adaptor subunit [Treponema sp.]|nr:efflux RND transporter periplasmic adaptor subunit [Treponema sp.]